jgi:hypothetical protein
MKNIVYMKKLEKLTLKMLKQDEAAQLKGGYIPTYETVRTFDIEGIHIDNYVQTYDDDPFRFDYRV